MIRSLAWLLLIVASSASISAQTQPYRLPELLLTAEDPEELRLSWWRTSDNPERFVSYFEDYQSKLSDAARVRILHHAAGLYQRGAHQKFLRSGPARRLIDLGLRAARGAENHDTIAMRALRVQLALGLDPPWNPDSSQWRSIGVREYLETERELAAINTITVPILTDHPDDIAKKRQSLIRAIEHWADSLELPWQGRPSADWAAETRLADLSNQDPHSREEFKTNPSLANSYAEIHQLHVSEFVGIEGFGIAREIHNDQRQVYRDACGQYWRVVQSQLISIMDRLDPVAYDTSKEGWDMKALGMEKVDSTVVPTRDLTVFEKAALKKALLSKEPQVVKFEQRIKMVAPVLARGRCLRCHEEQEGTALGAFSYLLEPDDNAAAYHEPRRLRRMGYEQRRAAAVSGND
ncbi:MAG: hypothetical protein ACI9DF_000468 [Verrucomicrobiales bacterium]|jgi:hypothetical protein